jgi:dynein intermediate chain 1
MTTRVKQLKSTPLKKKDIKPPPKDAQQERNNLKAISEEEDFYREPIKRIIRPDNQLQLSEKDLEEEFTRVLTGTDPNIATNTIKYNYKEKIYKLEPEGPMDHLAFHFQMNGLSLHKESEEASTQKSYEETTKEKAERINKELLHEAQDIGEDHIDINLIRPGKSQFNYSERAAQTINPGMRSRGVTTQPPSVIRFAATVTQWNIYDTYIDGISNQTQDGDSVQQSDRKKINSVTDFVSDNNRRNRDMMHTPKMNAILKLLERMVNQNSEDELYQDFKYWDDASDAFRNGLGSLLPLWKFTTEKCKRKHITSLRWNSQHNDLLAVGYGSYDFLHQGLGAVCCYSLKNTSHPEFIFHMESGVLCLDFHPQYSSLLAVGCYDGSVHVFDVRIPTKKPLYDQVVIQIRYGKSYGKVTQKLVEILHLFRYHQMV